MKLNLPTALAHRADSVDPQPIDPFAVIARGERSCGAGAGSSPPGPHSLQRWQSAPRRL